MEKKTQASRTGAHAAGARHAARPATASGASRSAAPRSGGASRSSGAAHARSAAAGASKSKRSAAPAGSAARRPSTGTHAAKRSAAGKAKRPVRRRGGMRLDIRDKRLWLIFAACALVIIIAVVLALTLPGGGKKDESVPASAAAVEDGNLPAEEEAAIADAGDIPADGGDAAGEPIADDGSQAAPEAGTADGPAIISSDSEIASQFSPEMVALMQKYQVLDGIPTTAQPLGIPEGERAPDSYFDDALFVGDSVTLKLQRYVTSTRKTETPNLLGTAKFLAAQSFSARNALMMVSEKSIHPVIDGEKMTLEDAIAKIGPGKLYLMLGMNDVGVSGLDGALENMGKLLERIREKNPNMRIIVESATPRLKGTHPTTNQLFAFDVLLYDAILKMNDPMIEFIDVAYAMRDAEGKLVEEYCDDPNNMAIHFTNAGCRQWIDYLYTHPSTAA